MINAINIDWNERDSRVLQPQVMHLVTTFAIPVLGCKKLRTTTCCEGITPSELEWELWTVDIIYEWAGMRRAGDSNRPLVHTYLQVVVVQASYYYGY